MFKFAHALTAALAVISTSAALAVKAADISESKPFAPDLYARSTLEIDNGQFETKKRAVQGASQPYAPNLFIRSKLQDLDDSYTFEISKDYLNGQIYLAGGSTSKKATQKDFCQSDVSCKGGYCGPKGKCLAKVENFKRCNHLNSACQSGYCSVKQNICKPKQRLGQGCIVSEGCLEGLTCLNGECRDYSKGESAPTVVKRDSNWKSPPPFKYHPYPPPWKPSPSGSPKGTKHFHHHHHHHHSEPESKQ